MVGKKTAAALVLAAGALVLGAGAAAAATAIEYGAGTDVKEQSVRPDSGTLTLGVNPDGTRVTSIEF